VKLLILFIHLLIVMVRSINLASTDSGVVLLGAICMAVVFLWFMCISTTILCLLGSMDMLADSIFYFAIPLFFGDNAWSISVLLLTSMINRNLVYWYSFYSSLKPPPPFLTFPPPFSVLLSGDHTFH